MYKIPPRQSSRGYRAADWNLSTPDWTGRMRVMEKNKNVRLKLEDRGSNELFAACPIEQYPGPAIEAVTDSSRYFVIKIVDVSGRSAFIGLGFSDRSDSFDLNVALQDHFKQLTKEVEISKEDQSSKLDLDLAFKEGQTIKVNINIPKSEKSKSKPKTGGGGLILPPPPGGSRPAPSKVPGMGSLTPVSSPVDSNKSVIAPASNLDLLCDLGADLNINSSTNITGSTNNNEKSPGDDPWGDFASAGADTKKSSGNWVQF